MAKLYFRYGAMGSSKSANILMVRYNYEERGQYAVLLKPRTDNRDGEHEIKSRIGLEAPAEYVDEFLKEISDCHRSNQVKTQVLFLAYTALNTLPSITEAAELFF